ncbi:MAG: hypothetical protein KAF91_07025 [Nostoc sp. TH1S01]|nr:hypothetical protein [Nostoc sp. TH1S01]
MEVFTRDRQDLSPQGGGLKPNAGEREQTDELLPVAGSLQCLELVEGFPLPQGVEQNAQLRQSKNLVAADKIHLWVGFIAGNWPISVDEVRYVHC